MNNHVPRITVDGIVINNQTILLIKRKNEPFKDHWALPGGFVEYGETTEHAVIREVHEETGVTTKINTIAGVYSDPQRDPRGHTISIVYVLDYIHGPVQSGDDAADARFFPLTALPALAFDHAQIVQESLKRLYNGVLPEM